jgi:hypothetical protein
MWSQTPRPLNVVTPSTLELDCNPLAGLLIGLCCEGRSRFLRGILRKTAFGFRFSGPLVGWTRAVCWRRAGLVD